MPFVTINRGGPDLPPGIEGVHRVILTEIGDPHTVTAQRGINAGKNIDLIDWTFSIDEPGQQLDATPITDATSTAAGPKSKLFAWVTALQNGVPPVTGQKLEKGDLIGRSAYATIRIDEGGYPKIANLGAIPVAEQQQRFAQQTGTPVQPAMQPRPAPAPVQPQSGPLPF